MSGGPLEPGAIVGDRYRLHRRLGEGGMGFVWEASHVFTHARFALKFLKGAREEDRRRFQREVRAAAAVRHPNVIGVHDFVELPNGMLVMVMDLLQGETLGALLRREHRLALADVAAIFLPVVGALEAAHAAGVVHRDLKPDNIFLSEKEGKDIEVKVLDFGVAKLTAVEGLAARTQALTGTGSMLGTPYYMAPEQIVSEKDLDARADIWSLGVVLYECLAGQRPTEGDNVGRVLKHILLVDFEPLTHHCKDLPEDVASLVAKMLVGDRDQRMRELGEVRAVLERHAAKRIPTYVRPEPTEPVDVHADTVAVPSERPAALARGETHHGMSMAGTAAPSRTRARVIGVAAVVVMGGAVALGLGLAGKKSTPTVAATAMTAPTHESSLATSATSATTTASVAASASALAAPLAVEPMASTTAVVASAVAPPRAVASSRRPALAAAPSALASASVASPSAAVPPPSAASAGAQAPELPKPSLGFAKSRKD